MAPLRLFVRGAATHTFTPDAACTVGDLKQLVAEREGVPAEEQRLVYAGASLEDEALLGEQVCEDATLHLTLSLLGGGKKRKKKTYTKPKKIPHKHKKVKLAVLKFYKVDGQDKVQ